MIETWLQFTNEKYAWSSVSINLSKVFIRLVSDLHTRQTNQFQKLPAFSAVNWISNVIFFWC